MHQSFAVQVFRDWLLRRLASSTPGELLLTETDMAAAFGISQSSVKRILTKLAQENRIYRIRGRGTFCGPPPPVDLHQTLRRERAVDSLVRKLQDMIFRGEIRQGTALPSQVYVKRRFGVSSDTIAAAYRTLERNGWVHRLGKKMWVGPLKPLLKESAGKTVYLVRFDTGSQGVDRIMPAYEKAEKELQNRGFRFSMISARDFFSMMGESAEHTHTPYGFILHFFNREDEFLRVSQRIRRHANKWIAEHVPILATITGFKVRSKPIITLNLGHIDTVVARSCAEFLRGKATRRVALMLTAHDRPPAFERSIKLYPELARIADSIDFKVAVCGSEAAQTEDVITRAGAAKSWEWLNAIMQKYRGISREEILSLFHFYPGMEDAFALCEDHTWVFYSDTAAYEAWRWRRIRAADRHGQTPIISLNDSFRLFKHGITACAPDWDTLGSMIANRIDGSIPVALSHSGSLEMQATVLERNFP